MSKKLPEKYEPGELQKTRERLGPLSREEAMKMSELLGGEVGSERADEGIEQRYQELKRRHTRSSGFIHPSKSRQYKIEENKAIFRPSSVTLPEKVAIRPRYLQRVKMSFLAARPDHLLMRKADAFAVLFSFLFSVKECINPHFITEGDAIFFRCIENLVLSVRSLLAINKKSRTQRMRPSFYLDILIVIRNWDIESLHWELSQLQKRPRRLSFSECKALTIELYKPIIKLFNLDPYSHIEAALRRLYELTLLSVAKGSKLEEKVVSYYRTAQAEIPALFQDLRYRCYPLLVKLISDHYYSYETFFSVKYKEILDFLELQEKDVLAKKRIKDESVGGTTGQEGKEEDKAEDSAITETTVDEGPIEEGEIESEQEQTPHEVKDGLDLLDRLFPLAGWKRIEQYPDFYAYFHPLFSYPRGVELIPPEDPLLVVTVLVSILQECFYGFRAMEFGSGKDPVSGYLDLQNQFDAITDSWHSFIDEIISKHYAAQLYEYCRQIERNPRFKSSAYGMKIYSDLMWIKRLYFLPFIRFRAVKGGRPSFSSHVPKLFEAVERMYALLGRIIEQIESPSDGNLECVKNWNTPYRFEIENPISKRLKSLNEQGLSVHYCNEKIPKNSNAVLLLYTMSILSVLHHLINDADSFLYNDDETPLYRFENGNSNMPLYSVPTLDTFALLKENEHTRSGSDKSKNARESTKEKDELTGLFSCGRLPIMLRRQIDEYHSSKLPFSIITLNNCQLEEYVVNFGKEAGDDLLKHCSGIIRRSLEHYSGLAFRGQDDQFFIILPGTEKRSALSQAVSLVTELTQEIKLPIACGVVEFHKTWGTEKVLKISERTADETKQFAESTIGVYETLRQTTAFIDPFTLKPRDIASRQKEDRVAEK